MNDRDIEDEIAMRLTYDLYDDYDYECERCSGPVPYHVKVCWTCELEARGVFDHEPTRGERREAERERQRLGMVKHSAPNVRPIKQKFNVRVK